MSVPQPSRARHYATRAKMRAFVEQARELGIKVGGIELAPDGTIRILAEQAVRAATSGTADDAYDDWKNAGN